MRVENSDTKAEMGLSLEKECDNELNVKRIMRVEQLSSSDYPTEDKLSLVEEITCRENMRVAWLSSRDIPTEDRQSLEEEEITCIDPLMSKNEKNGMRLSLEKPENSDQSEAIRSGELRVSLRVARLSAGGRECDKNGEISEIENFESMKVAQLRQELQECA